MESAEILSIYKDGKAMSEIHRKKLVALLVRNMVRIWGYYPKREQKTALAKATIALFPVFKMPNSAKDGIVSYKPNNIIR